MWIGVWFNRLGFGCRFDEWALFAIMTLLAGSVWGRWAWDWNFKFFWGRLCDFLSGPFPLYGRQSMLWRNTRQVRWYQPELVLGIVVSITLQNGLFQEWQHYEKRLPFLCLFLVSIDSPCVWRVVVKSVVWASALQFISSYSWDDRETLAAKDSKND